VASGSGRKIVEIINADSFTKDQARALEQVIIERYGRQINGGALTNIRQSVKNQQTRESLRAEFEWAERKANELGFIGGNIPTLP